MITRIPVSALAALLLTAATLLPGCGHTPTAKFYTLSSLTDSKTAPAHTFPDQPKVIVGIGPISLPAYLIHPAITTRNSTTTLSRAELHRWGGSLENEISRVLIENMKYLLTSHPYIILPWLEAVTNQVQVQLNITRFEGTSSGNVILAADWLIFTSSEHPLLLTGEAALAEPIETNGYPAITEAMSRALAELSRRIATDIEHAEMPTVDRTIP